MIKKSLLYLILLIGVVSFLYPFVWMILASLAPDKEIGSLVLFPSHITFNNYYQLMQKIPVWRALFNSLFVSSLVTFGVMIFGSMTGYALARLEFKGRNVLFFVIIFTMTIPFQITLIPQYIIMVKLHWTDTYLALIVPGLMNAFAIILFRQYFKSIPQDLIDAARIDGCGEFGIIFRVMWPNSIPALVTVGILTFMASWNDVLWPLIVIRDQSLMTMPQLVTLFVVGGRAESQLGVKLASAVLLALPIVISYMFFQKYFINSASSSGMKG